MKRRILATALAAALTGCATTPATITRDRPVEVRIPVPQPCAAAKPARPAALAERTPQWATDDIRQKVAAIGAWALTWVTYGEQLDAATAACPQAH